MLLPGTRPTIAISSFPLYAGRRSSLGSCTLSRQISISKPVLMELSSVQDCGTLNVLYGSDSVVHARERKKPLFNFTTLRKKATFAYELWVPFRTSCFDYLDNGSAVTASQLDE